MKSLGKHFLVGLEGPNLTPEEREILAELSPLGIIIFAHNIANEDNWQEALLKLLEQAKSLAKREKLLIAIDHEGGRVHRLKPPVTQFPLRLLLERTYKRRRPSDGKRARCTLL